MGKRGPAPKGQYENKTSVLSTRITSELRAALEASKKKSGRSLSQEIEHRLRRSFKEDRKLVDRFGGRQMYAVFQTAALVTELRLGHGNDVWLRDPYYFDQTLKAIVAVLEQFRPPPEAKSLRVRGFAPMKSKRAGKPSDAIAKSWDRAIHVAESTAGLHRAKEVVEIVARSDGALPVDSSKNTGDAKELAPFLRDDLGDLVKRLDPERMEDALRRASSDIGAAWDSRAKRRSPKRGRRGSASESQEG